MTRQQISSLPVNNSLNQLIETVPGIVRFSYNEPVAHGFHGVTYEIDGAPLPLATSSNFAEIIDPKNIDSMEIFTGAMPAEYGGSRQGAVINIISDRPSDLTVPYQGYLTAGVGNYGQLTTSFDNAAKAGNTEVFFNANTQENSRGLDTPTFVPNLDESSQSNQFLRTITTFNDPIVARVRLFEPTLAVPNPDQHESEQRVRPTFEVPGTQDVQREYDRFVNLNFTAASKDGNRIFQFIPWVRYTRIAYDGDLGSDILGSDKSRALRCSRPGAVVLHKPERTGVPIGNRPAPRSGGKLHRRAHVGIHRVANITLSRSASMQTARF